MWKLVGDVDCVLSIAGLRRCRQSNRQFAGKVESRVSKPDYCFGWILDTIAQCFDTAQVAWFSTRRRKQSSR